MSGSSAPGSTRFLPIVVRASGSAAGGVPAHFTLLLDGEPIGDAAAPGGTQTDLVFAAAYDDTRPHALAVAFDNDGMVDGQDRNLFVDSITVDGESFAANGPLAVYHAAGPGDIRGSGDMYWAGTLELDLPALATAAPPPPATLPPPPAPTAPPPVVPSQPEPGVGTTLTVRASGSPAAGVAPHFTLLLDGQAVGAASVGTGVGDYSFEVPVSSGQPHSVEVVFDNDAAVGGEDRNLFVESLAVGGQTYAATGPQAVYHAPGQGDIAGSGNMWWGGALAFSILAGSATPPALSEVLPPVPPATSPALAGPAFYVAVGGDDAADGSSARPFASLARAAAAMEQSGVRTTYLEGGTYNLSAPVTLGSADSGMAFLAYPGQSPILDGGSAGLQTLVRVSGATDVTLSGLGFAHAGSGGAALALDNSARIQVLANRFTDNGNAIVLTGSSGNRVAGNQIDNSAQSAVEAKDGSNSNIFDSNVIDGTGAIAEQGGGFFLHGVNGNSITHNLVQNTAGVGIAIANWDDSTINVGNTVAYNIVRNTSMHSVDSGAIYMLGRSHVDTQAVISHNLIEGTGAGGDAHTVGIYLDDSTSGVVVEGNIVRGIGTHGAQIHGGDDIIIRNNIFDLGSGDASAVLFQAAPADTNPTNTMRNDQVVGNIIQSSSGSPNVYSYLDGGSPDITRNLYFSVVGAIIRSSGATADSNPVYGDPKFANAGAGDYRLGDGSAAAAIGFQSIDQSQFGPLPGSSAGLVR